MKLNLGCGKNPMPGWVNLDRLDGPGVDLVCDLESLCNYEKAWATEDEMPGVCRCERERMYYTCLPTPGSSRRRIGKRDAMQRDTVSELRADHLIEHIRNPLPMMQELWRVAEPGALFTLTCPYGSSDDAWENQTHVRPYFVGSWLAFSAPYYWREDYGYGGDWQAKHIMLKLREEALRRLVGGTDALSIAAGTATVGHCEVAMRAVNTYQNMVAEMEVILEAVKPAREQKRELLEYPVVQLVVARYERDE